MQHLYFAKHFVSLYRHIGNNDNKSENDNDNENEDNNNESQKSTSKNQQSHIIFIDDIQANRIAAEQTVHWKTFESIDALRLNQMQS